MQSYPVAKIIVKDRVRKDFGDLRGLADSIAELGLLQPVGITKDLELVFGERRLRAVRDILKWAEIPTREVNLEAILLGELAENEVRKDFTPSERVEIGKRLEVYLGERRGNPNLIVQNFAQLEEDLKGKKTRDVAAEKAGFGNHTSYEQAKQVVELATPELVEAMDSEKISISAAASIAKKAPEFQKKVAEKIKTGNAKSGQDAIRQAKDDFAKAKRTKAAAEIKETNSSIIVGDFWQNADKIPDNSLSLIFTDPPYDKAAETHIAHLADFAARKLAPGGSCLFYLGHLQLPSAFKAFEGKLRHWWTCACVHAGGMAVMNYYGVRVGWKPMLWFVKESRFDTQNIVVDTVSSGTEKQHHDWQQAESEAAYWIEKLCPADGIVCDPFLGGGTTAAAAIKLNRKWIGFEIDPETARIASGRLEGK